MHLVAIRQSASQPKPNLVDAVQTMRSIPVIYLVIQRCLNWLYSFGRVVYVHTVNLKNYAQLYAIESPNKRYKKKKYKIYNFGIHISWQRAALRAADPALSFEVSGFNARESLHKWIVWLLQGFRESLEAEIPTKLSGFRLLLFLGESLEGEKLGK